MKILIISILTLFFLSNVVFASELEFEIIKEGDWFEREAIDRVYSAVIYSHTGLVEFLKEYPVGLKLPDDFFENKILILGFSDTTAAVTVDEFKRRSGEISPYFYLDLYDMGMEFKRLSPKKGIKYTSYCAIGVDKNLVIAHVQIREGISGLCKQYDKSK